jgi:hypothetical protein
MKPLGQKRRRLAGVLDRSGSDVPRRGEQAGGAWESNVKTAASNEFEDVEFEDGGFLGGAVGPLEEDVAVRIVAEDSFSTEGGALDVTGKVAEGGFSTTDGLKLDVPLGLGIEGAVLVWGQFGENVRVICFEGALDEAAEAGGERQVVDEEVLGSRKGLRPTRFVFGTLEGFVFGVEGDGGDDDVDVGMVLGLAAPGVEDGGEVEDEAVVFELGAGDIVQGSCAAFEEKVVKGLGLVEAQGAELLWYCEGDHEVRDS